MSRRTSFLWIALFVGLAVSGCAGQSGPKASPTSTEPPPLVPEDADYGAIEGYVVDSELRPRDNVTVAIVGMNNSVLTDASGYYLFLPLDPGNYHLRVNVSLYVPVERNLSVPQGDSLRSDFTLVRIPNPEPYVDAGYTRTGQLQCQVRANATGTDTNPSCSDTPASSITGSYVPPSQGANVTLLQGVGGLVIEVKWTSAVPVANDKLRLSIRIGSGMDATWKQVEGPSVLRVEIGSEGLADLGRFAEKNYTQEGGSLFFNLYPGEAASQSGAGGAGATFQQSYTMYVTVFYREAPTAHYTRLK